MSAGALGDARPTSRFAGARAVFERDFLVFTSRPRFLVLRTLVVALPALVLTTSLALPRRYASASSSDIGQAIFGLSTAIVPTLVLLLAPVLAASCIASERALSTLPIVLSAPVSPFGFVLAKFASRLGVVLVLVLATLPLVGTCFLYGGVGGSLFLDLFAFLAGLAVLGTASGIVASAWSRGVAVAARVSYVLAIVVPLLHLAAEFLLMRWRGHASFETPLPAANPFFAWAHLLAGAQRGAVVGWPGALFLACTIVVAALALPFSAWRVSREAAHETAPAAVKGRASGLRWSNPVLDRGLRGTLLHRPRIKSWLALAFLVVIDATLLAVFGALDSLDAVAGHLVFLGCTTLVLVMYAMSLAANAVAAERETGALDMLFATRLTAGDIVRGKLAAVLLSVAPLALFASLHAAVAVATTKVRLVTLFAWSAQTAVVVVFCASFGLWCSAAASTAARAALRTYAFLIGAAVVHVGLAAVFSFVAVSSSLADGDVLAYVWGASPFFVGTAGLFLTADARWNSSQGHLAAAWVLWMAAYVAASAILVGWTTARLARRNEAG